MEELRPRVEREREEGAMGTETMERVAILALLWSRAEGEGGLCVPDRKPQGQGKDDDDKVAQATSADLVGRIC